MRKKRLIESQTLTITPTDEAAKGKLLVQLISAGWGSSGYYSPKVLENAATAKVFPAGTHMYLDHPSESERHDRPERSVRDLAAVLTEDARYDSSGALIAEVQATREYTDRLTDPVFLDNVGTSIVAYADTTVGEAEGRKGTIVTELVEGVSTDFVTKAGRGGKVLAVLESARRVDEATANDTREALNVALRAAYGADDTWVWVRDWDDTQVWFTVEDSDSMTTYQQGYTLADTTATLADGDPTEVRARTEYVPVTATTEAALCPGCNQLRPARESHEPPVAPAGSTPTHESPKEDTMPQIEEARLRQLEADAGRVQTAEETSRTAEQRAQVAEARAQAAENREAARAVIGEANHQFTPLEIRGLLAELPTLEESGELDRETFTTTVTEAATQANRTHGSGLTGFGDTDTGDGTVVESYKNSRFMTVKGA